MKHNFYAGPSIIDESVLKSAGSLVRKTDEYLSILEISHRSKRFGELMEETLFLAKSVLRLSDEFDVIYLHGGGRQQFYQIPFNLSGLFKTSYYIDSGSWAMQAYQEALHFGKAEILASSKGNGYRSLPSFEMMEDSSYYYMVTNNTIFGTQFNNISKLNAPLVGDMSSDLFSREIEFNLFDLFFSATQKNAGTAGGCLVYIKRGLLKKDIGSIPKMIDYRTHINKKSLYNTPPVFSVLMTNLTLKWIVQQGGVSHLEKRNKEKASLLYGEIDRNAVFTGYAEKEHRSDMNVVFNGLSNELEERFISYAEKSGIVGIHGHWSIGGFRASLYNALPIDSVKVLIDVMQEFERTQA